MISCENDLHLCREYFARGIGTFIALLRVGTGAGRCSLLRCASAWVRAGPHCSAACRHGCRQVRPLDGFFLCSWQMCTMPSLFSLECLLRHWTTSHILWEGGGWAPLSAPGAPRPGHTARASGGAAGRPAEPRRLSSRVGALTSPGSLLPSVFLSESPSCTAFPCGRKTWCKARLSRLWVTLRASRRVCSLRVAASSCCGWRPGPQGLAGALQGKAGPGFRSGASGTGTLCLHVAVLGVGLVCAAVGCFPQHAYI